MEIIVIAFIVVAAPCIYGILSAIADSRDRYQAEVNARRSRDAATVELAELLGKLRENPGALEAAVALQAAVRQLHFVHLSTAESGMAYQAALDCLEHNSTSVKAKTIVLEVGRWHHARCRDENLTTIFDESAMQNDILVRCQILPQPSKQEVG